jgi:hypothetical protein
MKKSLLLMLLVIVSLQLPIKAQFDVDANLLLYLSFDESDITANDQDVAKLNSVVNAATGKFGKAAIFDGASYIAMAVIPAYEPRAKSVAFSFWMKTGVTTGEDIMVYAPMPNPQGTDIEGRLAVSLRFDNKLGGDIGWVGGNLESDPGPNNAAGLVSDNNWHHVVVSYLLNGVGINMFIDNVLVEERTMDGFGEFVAGDAWDFTNFNLFLGGGCSDYPGAELGWAPTFTGAIDEFRMFQTEAPLTPDQVGVLYRYVPVVNSVNSSKNSQSIKVYPNPATDLLKIQSSGKNITVDIMNSVGQKVISTTNNRQIDISSLTKGIYFVKVADGNLISTQKVLVK